MIFEFFQTSMFGLVSDIVSCGINNVQVWRCYAIMLPQQKRLLFFF